MGDGVSATLSGGGLSPPVRQRGMDYLRARLVTPYYYKKVIATGVMNHDRFVGVDAPYRDAQRSEQGAGAKQPGFDFGGQTLVKGGPGRGAPEVTPRSPRRPLGTENPNTVNLPHFEETSDQILRYPLYPDGLSPQPR
jgi:hypothetical protein